MNRYIMEGLGLICRLCLKKQTIFDLIEIFSENGRSKELCMKIFNIFHIKVTETQNLPKAICLFCYNKLEDYWKFSVQVLENQRKLCGTKIMLLQTESMKKVDGSRIKSKENQQNIEKSAHTKINKNSYEQSPDNNFPDSNDEETFSNVPDVAASQELNKKSRYICHYCEKSFTKKTSLATHIMVKHFGVRYPCPSCHKMFNYRNDLKYHTKTVHSPHRPKNKCPECKTVVFDLVKHIERHRERNMNIRCEMCDKQLSNKKSLVIHVKRIHSEVKHTFSCEICGKVFSARISLKNHLSIHSGTFLYNCNYCDRKFRNTGNKSRHVKKIHLQIKSNES